MDNRERRQHEELPAQYAYVADDILSLCKPRAGIWLDVGTGPGGLALALARQAPGSVLVLMDPNPEALGKALQAAGELGLDNRVVSIVCPAEAMPLPDSCIDLVVSRGSIFFWNDPVRGISEAHRVLSPGGEAMIGGGLGREYPAWARREFIRRQRENQRKRGPEAMRRFREVRSPETFHRWAGEAGLRDFTVVGEGGLDEDCPEAGVGIWLRFTKGCHAAGDGSMAEDGREFNDACGGSARVIRSTTIAADGMVE